MTPIGVAGLNGRPAFVELLRAHGADPHLMNDQCETPRALTEYQAAKPESGARVTLAADGKALDSRGAARVLPS